MKYQCAECRVWVEKTKKPEGKNVFCSHNCAAKYNNRTPRKTGNQHSANSVFSAVKVVCGFCLNEFKGSQSRKFCSTECSRQYRLKKSSEHIEAGNALSVRAMRGYLIRTKGHKCELCLTADWMNQPVPLTMDHIDGNSDNNNLDNLRLICPNCDALLPTYKSKNRGNGRAYRRQRYSEGKSY